MTFEEWAALRHQGMIELMKVATRSAWEAAQPKWRPMETAPRKGLVDVLLLQKSGRQAVASYTHVFVDHPEGCWAYNDDIIPDPVAWMPLPQPPGSKQ